MTLQNVVYINSCHCTININLSADHRDDNKRCGWSDVCIFTFSLFPFIFDVQDIWKAFLSVRLPSCLSVCLLTVCVCLPVLLSSFLAVCARLSAFMSMTLSACLPSSLSECFPIVPSAFLHFCLSAFLTVLSPVCPSMSLCLFVCFKVSLLPHTALYVGVL